MQENTLPFDIRPVSHADRPGLIPFLTSFWRSERMVARGRLFYPAQQEGFAAWNGDAIAGLITFERSGDEMEITLLDSRVRNQGLGTALVNCVVEKARESGCRRVWAVATNDNIRAFRFYQKRGFDLAQLHRNAAEASRKLKPEIPLTGQEGIAIRHELEFEYLL
jgi:GNAT superfamily N-acetyltransferase